MKDPNCFETLTNLICMHVSGQVSWLQNSVQLWPSNSRWNWMLKFLCCRGCCSHTASEYIQAIYAWYIVVVTSKSNNDKWQTTDQSPLRNLYDMDLMQIWYHYTTGWNSFKWLHFVYEKEWLSQSKLINLKSFQIQLNLIIWFTTIIMKCVSQISWLPLYMHVIGWAETESCAWAFAHQQLIQI